MSDGPLDMRMDRSQERTAAEIVNYESEKELADLIFKLGEEKEEPEDSQSNRAGAAINTNRSVWQLDRAGCAPHGKNSSGNADVHGVADRCQRRAGGVGCAAKSIPQLVKPGGRVGC